MAEAEDVITDAARHATVFVQDLWRRHRPLEEKRYLGLDDAASRLNLLALAVFRCSFRLRPCQAPLPRTWLEKIIRRNEAPPPLLAVPGTDGTNIWLPRNFGIVEPDDSALDRYRILLLQQAVRAMRESARFYPFSESCAVQAIYHIFEAQAADEELIRQLPGLIPSLQRLRQHALLARPAAGSLPAPLGVIEGMVQKLLAAPIEPCMNSATSGPRPPAVVLEKARQQVEALPEIRRLHRRVLLKDLWTDDLFTASIQHDLM